MHLGELVTAASVVFALASAGWAGLRQGEKKDQQQREKNLRDANDDLRKEVSDWVRRDAERQQLQEAAAEKIQALQSDMASLAKVVTAEAHMVVLGEQIAEIGERLNDVGVEVSEIHGVLIPEGK